MRTTLARTSGYKSGGGGFTPSRKLPVSSVTILFVLFGIVAIVIFGRLFYLQIVKYDFYREAASREHLGYTELPAKRGEILVQDYTSGDLFTAASNTTMDLIYVDPKLVANKTLVARTLADTIFDLDTERKKDDDRIASEKREFKRTGNIDAYDRVSARTDDELKENFYQEILKKVTSDVRSEIILANNLPQDVLDIVLSKRLNGIEVQGASVIAYPPKIYDKRHTALELSDELQIPAPRLEQLLIGENRYEIVAKKVDAEKSKILKEIIKKDKDEHPDENRYAGIGFQEEYYRFYPEKNLAANILGFVDSSGKGQYGIEESFEKQLQGKKGIFKAQKDSIGRQITVGESVIQPAINGTDVILTIDRNIQLEVERLIKKGVDQYRATAGQVIVMDPKTGKIIAMAHYPSFDPNDYSDAYKKTDVNFSSEEITNLVPASETATDQFYFYRNYDAHDRYLVFKNEEEGKDAVYQRYTNWFGPEVYKNKLINEVYEPGSVFKPIVMAAAIDDGDVTPETTYYESGPIKVDEFEIHNSTETYRGLQTMTNVLEESSNIGMAWVAKKIGRNLFYSYVLKFGFAERLGIELDNEQKGFVEYFTEWAESELVTRAFGQGLTVTPLQLASAYSVLANKGVLMEPYIVAATRDHTGKVFYTEPQIIRQVISEETANKITAMLVSAVENGVAPLSKVDGHYVAGKSGTAQTYKHGQPLTGVGTTITTFAGYAPVDDPLFVVVVKFDFPKTSEWCAQTSAPLAAEIEKFLFNYYNIPPDK
ncbi:penicillin-binding protein 2 [Candidatus Peregrinibacteria bacterium]|nr:penicillin-binding protein 2 [Candidatus Peregrinibacteria bacterium]